MVSRDADQHAYPCNLIIVFVCELDIDQVVSLFVVRPICLSLTFHSEISNGQEKNEINKCFQISNE